MQVAAVACHGDSMDDDHDVDAAKWNAVRRTDAESGRRVTDPEEAVAVWRALVDGHWIIEGKHQRDGRCYVIVRQRGAATALPSSLSRREREVAARVALGHANKDIASALQIAPSTVATHLRAVLAKLGARSRAQVAKTLLEGAPRVCARSRFSHA